MSQGREASDYTNKARIYAESRPDYAPSAFQYLVETAYLTAQSIVADIGAGTGKSSFGFLGIVSKVYAVDCSEEMLNEAIRLFGSHPAFEARVGSAEQIPLDDSVADMAVVGQALHWFDIDKAKAEFQRILKPNGLVAIMWNDFGNTPRPPVESFLSRGMTEKAFDASYTEGWDRFIQGELSSHYAPKPGDDSFESFVEERRKQFSTKSVNGLLAVSLTTRVITGTLT